MQGTDRQRLDARIGHGDGWTALRLDGVIDEHNGLAGLTAVMGPGADALLLDLGGIRRINSVGVRDWVVWLRAQRERYRFVVLFDCPPAIMNEVNLVANFAEGCVITTFQAPYYCDRCGQESVQTLDAPAMIAQDVRKAPLFPCGKPACANALDDAEETYFAFFDDQRRVARPPDLDALVAAARETLATASTTADASAPVEEKSLDLRAAEARLAKASVPTGAPVSASSQRSGKQDPVFIAILLVMLGILGVLVYLITTLE